MSTNGVDRRRALALAGLAWIGRRSVAAAQGPAPSAGTRSDDTAGEPHRLPPAATTHHTLELPGRTLHFEATAGAILLTDEKHAPRAELAFIAFQLEGAERARRPVTFVFNGGPGFASAWLNLGAVGPWRIALGGDATAPSASPEPMPNAETWLDFTDLVFIDPAGTGYSRALASSPDARRRLWSVEATSNTSPRRSAAGSTGSTAMSRRNTCWAKAMAASGCRGWPRTRRRPGHRRLRPGDDIAGARPWRPQCRVRTVRLCDAAALDDRRRACRAGVGDARRPRGCRTATPRPSSCST